MTIAEQIASLKFEVKHIRNPQKRKDDDDWQQTADQWLFVFDKGLTFDFFTGIGSRVAKHHLDKKECDRLKYANLTQFGFEKFIEMTKPVAPKLDSLLNCLAGDSRAEDQSFEDWASDFGLTTDSRKGLEMYLESQESGKKLRQLGFRDLEALREHYQDY